MRIIGLPRALYHVAQHPPPALSHEAQERLRWLSCWQAVLDIRLLPGVVLKHFTARDVVSRWDVIEVHSRATASTACHFLDTIHARMPFPIKALQVDGGTEFQASFEQACQERGIRLFVLPPRSPKLNGHVERAHRTHSEEFYEVYHGQLEVRL